MALWTVKHKIHILKVFQNVFKAIVEYRNLYIWKRKCWAVQDKGFEAYFH